MAKTMDDTGSNLYEVTDEDGCATDPDIFGEWKFDRARNALSSTFNAFKFPSSNNIRFQCNVRVCFGKCQPVSIEFFQLGHFEILVRKIFNLQKRTLL